MTDIHKLEDDAPRYVIEALIQAGRPLSIDDLVEHYDPPKPNDLADARESLRCGSVPATNYDAKVWLIENAIVEINNSDYVIETGKVDEDGEDEWIRVGEVLVEADHGKWRLADGVDPKLLWRDRLGGPEPLLRKSPLPDLFTPGTGLWVNNSRSTDPSDHKDLRESMQALGWLKHLPAIGCKRTEVIIVGHRRIAVAKELDIEPVIEWYDFGEGPAAEAAKAALAIASNLGGKPLTPADRKKIAADLYGDGSKFSMPEIGELLNVSAMTISRDLRGLTDVKPPKGKGGRPRKQEVDPPTPPEPSIPVPPTPEPPAPPEPPGDPDPPASPTPTPVPAAITENTPGVTDRVNNALTKVQQSADNDEDSDDDDEPKPPREHTAESVRDLLCHAGADLDSLTGIVMSFDDHAKASVFNTHLDRLSALARKVQNVVEVVSHAENRVTPRPKRLAGPR